jgi:hypothetical protein
MASLLDVFNASARLASQGLDMYSRETKKQRDIYIKNYQLKEEQAYAEYFNAVARGEIQNDNDDFLPGWMEIHNKLYREAMDGAKNMGNYTRQALEMSSRETNARMIPRLKDASAIQQLNRAKERNDENIGLLMNRFNTDPAYSSEDAVSDITGIIGNGYEGGVYNEAELFRRYEDAVSAVYETSVKGIIETGIAENQSGAQIKARIDAYLDRVGKQKIKIRQPEGGGKGRPTKGFTEEVYDQSALIGRVRDLAAGAIPKGRTGKDTLSPASVSYIQGIAQDLYNQIFTGDKAGNFYSLAELADGGGFADAVFQRLLETAGTSAIADETLGFFVQDAYGNIDKANETFRLYYNYSALNDVKNYIKGSEDAGYRNAALHTIEGIQKYLETQKEQTKEQSAVMAPYLLEETYEMRFGPGQDQKWENVVTNVINRLQAGKFNSFNPQPDRPDSIINTLKTLQDNSFITQTMGEGQGNIQTFPGEFQRQIDQGNIAIQQFLEYQLDVPLNPNMGYMQENDKVNEVYPVKQFGLPGGGKVSAKEEGGKLLYGVNLGDRWEWTESLDTARAMLGKEKKTDALSTVQDITRKVFQARSGFIPNHEKFKKDFPEAHAIATQLGSQTDTIILNTIREAAKDMREPPVNSRGQYVLPPGQWPNNPEEREVWLLGYYGMKK